MYVYSVFSKDMCHVSIFNSPFFSKKKTSKLQYFNSFAKKILVKQLDGFLFQPFHPSFFGHRQDLFWKQGKVDSWNYETLKSPMEIPSPKKWESQKETHLPTIHFQGRTVELPGGMVFRESFHDTPGLAYQCFGHPSRLKAWRPTWQTKLGEMGLWLFLMENAGFNGETSSMFYCFIPNWGKWFKFDEHIFQMGWNHQLQKTVVALKNSAK